MINFKILVTRVLSNDQKSEENVDESIFIPHIDTTSFIQEYHKYHCQGVWHAISSLVPTCPKNRKNRGFLRFPDTGILTTFAILAILRTARFTFIVKIADVWDVWDSTFKVEMIPILPIRS